MARVGEPCPVCRKQMGPGTNSRQMTCGSECGIVYKARRTEERRHERYAKALAAVTAGGQAPPPTYPHGPVAELTRPSAWADEPAHEPAVPTQPRSGRYRRVLVWPDTHLPYADPKAVDLALQIGRYYQPDLVILLGDMIDGTGFSRFPHDQVTPKSFLQTELDEWHVLAESIREMSPKAERIYIIGNHEKRVERWLWGQPHLTGFHGFKLGNLLNLAEHGFAPEPVHEVMLCGGALTVTHGTFTGGQSAGNAARQQGAKFGTSSVTGHTHRLALVTHRDKAGLRMNIEGGHLALNPQHYLPEIANWAQGVVIGEVSQDGNDFELVPVPFRLSYRCLVDGREFSA